MSKSRLEKFLYALYSLDSSDLPNPLSRIEKLYRCLVTGEEAPTFEPLSRVEKYLMAIFGLYDLETQVEQGVLCTENNDVIVDENENYICLDEVMSGGIPAPISRIEKLLYKLATGDDNLDDVKPFLSKHEELLAEIIRNGGVGGDINIEYVLHTLSTEFNTLYNTAEKPVKSAILKGNTLVNVNRSNYTANANITTDYGQAIEFYDADMKPSTTYTIIMYSDNLYECRFSQMYDDREYALAVVKVGTPFVFTTAENHQGLRSYLKGDELNIPQGTEIKILIMEGDYTNLDIPYFEGMQSVKMPVLTTTGKNLFDGELKIGTIFSNGTTGAIEDCLRSSNYIKLEQNIDYVISNDKGYSHVIFGYNSNKEFVERIGSYSGNGVFKLTGNIEYIMFRSSDTLKQNDLSVKYQIEKGTVATPFEPYKSNILTINEEVTLHGIGDVRDELNPFTGELTQRIGEFVFDEDEGFKMSTSDNNAFFYHELGENILIPSFTKKMISNNLLDYSDYATMKNTENSMYTNGKNIYIHLTNDINSVSLLQTYLANNPIKIIACLSNESVKTVDLSVVDQDGNDTKLKTFNDLTHVTLSSEGLIPEAELEVATKNEEVLNTMSLEMDDISTTQTTLEETSNTQSENVDATMIATTEIYEELL